MDKDPHMPPIVGEPKESFPVGDALLSYVRLDIEEQRLLAEANDLEKRLRKSAIDRETYRDEMAKVHVMMGHYANERQKYLRVINDEVQPSRVKKTLGRVAGAIFRRRT